MVSVIAPALFRWPEQLIAADHATLNNAVPGAMAAIIVGYYFMRRLASFPGVHAGAHILVSFAMPYGVLTALFLALRMEYSGYVLVSSFVIALIWFHGVDLASRRLVVPVLAVVPGGDTGSLTRIGAVHWIKLSRPALAEAGVNGIVADLRHDFSSEWERFIADCTLAGIPVYHSKQVREALTGKVEIEHLSENMFGSLLPNRAYLRIKQLCDWWLALAALPLFALTLSIVGPLILLTSGRPVFFRQPRVGYGGRVFQLRKFRTMKTGDDSSKRAASAGAAREDAITRDCDDRVTRIGAFLRTYRIDEFAQILNILRGEMSWIGPRPEALALAEWYEGRLPFYRYRHAVRPGITGWAQVNQGHVAAPEEVLGKLHYDFFYIKNLSPWMDVLVVLKTIRTILTGFGAR